MRYSILFIEFKGIGLDDGIFLFLSEVFEEFRSKVMFAIFGILHCLNFIFIFDKLYYEGRVLYKKTVYWKLIIFKS